MSQAISFFQRRRKQLALAASLYVILLILFHWQLPPVHVWLIAAFFSIIMNFTYMTEAYARQECLKLEVLVASVLILASVLGAAVWPLFVIAAIFGHGVWDIFKHYGAGVPFFSWYTLSCFAVDTLYSGALLVYWMEL
ncbi:hypothetical protein [Parasedimentitalea huanghaiensis]|uniref:Uncharacterized protein n=1 Tax=Parasedimentitalea huanghaiensis TaxID=2682100 RepID=A0A6L6WE83_9RHOB|nr:hypothetical protein [Zongyanglinia huanghaiensis]MVO15269.1 hypothetical protein [Zongyanglinia huanghaiensis]